MTSVYPMEVKAIPPPTYEQATYGSQIPSMPNTYSMYSASTTGFPQPIGMCPTSVMGLPPQAPPIGTSMLIATQSLMFGDIPVQCTCPHCYQIIVTRVEKREGLLPWLICGGILLMGGWLGCCLIPFCIDSLKDTEHYCPHCAALLGSQRRL